MTASRNRLLFVIVGTVLATAWALAQVVQTPEALENKDALSKPLAQFTIGDIFPKSPSDLVRSSGKTWQDLGDKVREPSAARAKAANELASGKKGQASSLKDELKEAKAAKDFVKIGTIEGSLKAEESVKRILGYISELSKDQAAMGESWAVAGEALQGLADSDDKFNQHRSRTIVKPMDVGGQDQRLDAAGVEAFREQNEAMDLVGKRFEDFASKLRNLVATKSKLIKELEKGGYVQPPK